MGRRLFVLMLLVSGLIGCSSNPKIGRLGGDPLIDLANKNSTANICSDKGFMSKSSAHNYGYLSTQVMALFEVDEDLYERTYRFTQFNLSSLSEEALYPKCANLRAQLPRITEQLTADYRKGTYLYQQRKIKLQQDRRELLFMAVGASQELGQQAQNMGNAANGFTYDQINNHQGSSVTGFNVDENGTNHYLINTDSGTVQCHVTPSGYTFCN